VIDRRLAERIVRDLLYDIEDHSGFGSVLEQMEPDSRWQLEQQWIKIVMGDDDK